MISVLIPTFNAGRFIDATLSSIERQDHPCEIIIADGGSTDDTLARAAGHPLVKTVLHGPDEGQLDAVQRALAQATGDIVCWINADDIVMPGAFVTVTKIMASRPAAEIVFSDDFAFDEERQALWVGPTIRGMTYLDHLLFYRQMYSECVYWRRDVSRTLSQAFFDLRIYTDYAFMLHLRRGRRAVWTRKRLGAFRVRPDQVSAISASDRKAEEFRRIRRDHWRTHVSPAGWAYRLAQGLYAPWFYVRQWVVPKADSARRRACRFVDGDRRRRALARWFFADWLKPSVSAEDTLPAPNMNKARAMSEA